MKMKTSELEGAALDWAVNECEGGYDRNVLTTDGQRRLRTHNYSTNWTKGGPIIERMEIGIKRHAPCSAGREWEASPSITAKGAGGRWGYGPTPLIAAMRCLVASKLGDEIEVPEELL